MMKTMIAASAVALISTSAMAEGNDYGAHLSLDAVEWVDAPIPGVQLALAWGDDATGARWLIKMEPGVALPMHTHTNDYWGLRIEGNHVHIEPDGTEDPSRPGDFSLVRGGEPHADRCDGDIPCVVLLDFAGPRDVTILE